MLLFLMLNCSVVFLCFELPNIMKLVFETFNISLLTANHNIMPRKENNGVIGKKNKL